MNSILTLMVFVNIGEIASSENNTFSQSFCEPYNETETLKDYTFIGCYEAPAYNVADNQALLFSNMTREICIPTCLQNGKPFSGVEGEDVCRCSDSLDMFEAYDLVIKTSNYVPKCNDHRTSSLYHSDFILNVTLCGIPGFQPMQFCGGLTETSQCLQFCGNFTAFVILKKNDEISCACSNDDIANLTMPATNDFNRPCSQKAIRACFSSHGCYSPFPNHTIGFVSANLTHEYCVEYCLYIGRDFAGIEHGNYCRCDTNFTIFEDHGFNYQSCDFQTGATLYFKGGPIIHNVSACGNNTSLTCDGVDVITNCSEHCQKFSSKDPVPEVLQTPGKVICHCSDNENIRDEIIPNQDTENCTYFIMTFYQFTEKHLPNTETSAGTTSSNIFTTFTESTTTERERKTTLSPETTQDSLTNMADEYITETTMESTKHYSTFIDVLRSTEVPQTESSSLESYCHCPCSSGSSKWDYLNGLNLTKEQLEVYLEEELANLRGNLTIDPKGTSAFKNTKISAPDSRPSSAAVGALGIILLTVIFGLIIISDVLSFFRSRSWTPGRKEQ
ncbi:uncharacterized protein LOC127738271 isoform X2 [Mytilus californianus]|uniref:uncharacterized protein LOC127738271 isoform X1 n=1 Tax=Mytilus californianus TaxID=6549 RepID=UPI002245DBA4|nr:uncharacterized protein LOC127738271 isoform X1 [Mytilus californianus]XP_052105416.1 uncharacterized protein LOC127738271 isoform X2 [Mytilus californianus]